MILIVVWIKTTDHAHRRFNNIFFVDSLIDFQKTLRPISSWAGLRRKKLAQTSLETPNKLAPLALIREVELCLV